MAWNKCPSVGNIYSQQRNKDGHEKTHIGRDLGFANTAAKIHLLRTVVLIFQLSLPHQVFMIF